MLERRQSLTCVDLRAAASGLRAMDAASRARLLAARQRACDDAYRAAKEFESLISSLTVSRRSSSAPSIPTIVSSAPLESLEPPPPPPPPLQPDDVINQQGPWFSSYSPPASPLRHRQSPPRPQYQSLFPKSPPRHTPPRPTGPPGLLFFAPPRSRSPKDDKYHEPLGHWRHGDVDVWGMRRSPLRQPDFPLLATLWGR